MNSGMRSTTYVAHGTNYSTSWAFTEVYTRDLSEMPEDVKTQLANYIQGGTPANPSANGRGEAFAEIFQTRYGSCDSAIDRLIKQHFDDTVAWVYALLPPPVLTATTGAARGVSASGGTLHGSADAFGVATSYRFEYGPTSAYGSSTALADAGAGVGAVEVAAQVDGLTPGTTYHYRVVVVRWGVAVLYGADTQFTTGSSPTALRPFVIVAPTIGGSPGVGGRLSCAPGSWGCDSPITCSHAWLSDTGMVVGGDAGYTVSEADRGHSLRCEVTATNQAGSAVASSGSVQIAAASVGGATGGPSPPGGDQSSSGAAPPAGDTTPPTAALSGKRTHKLGRWISLTVKATRESLWVSASGRLAIRGTSKTWKLKGVKSSFVARGHKATLRLLLPNKARAAARRALARRHKVTAKLKLSLRDQAGNTATQPWNVKLRR